MPGDESWLRRWSRRKRESVATPAAPAREAPPGLVASGDAAANPAPVAPVALPPLESLMAESDFTPFMQPGVRPELRQAALKKLFADPHFNVMDGLDVYIDDYTRPDPLAAAVVSGLAQFRNLDGLQRDPTEEARCDEAAVQPARASAAASLPDTCAEPLPGAEGTTPASAATACPDRDTKSRAEPDR